LTRRLIMDLVCIVICDSEYNMPSVHLSLVVVRQVF
jgi:hypothetical protein